MDPCYTVNKKPDSYDPYRPADSALHRTIAEAELYETPERAEQALALFREWIAKNPAIKSCRTDASFLLRFLRVRKFNHLEACETLERFLTMKQQIPEWYQGLDTGAAYVDEFIESDLLQPLGFDQTGRFVILWRYGSFDVEKYDKVLLAQFVLMVVQSYLEDERVQIAGCVFIWENSQMTMKVASAWSISEIRLHLYSVNKSIPIRVKAVHAVSLPLFATTLGEWILRFSSEKLRSRIECHPSMLSVLEKVSDTLIPVEFGGKTDSVRVREELRERLRRHRDLLRDLDKMEIDVSKSSLVWAKSKHEELASGTIGSFRKLTVD